jgi:hypothetical protein
MFSSTDESLASQFCLVYEKQTGKVVHIHEFISVDPAGRCAPDELETQALQLAPAKYARSDLATFHPKPDQIVSRQFKYRVDCDRNKLLIEKASEASASDLRTSRHA